MAITELYRGWMLRKGLPCGDHSLSSPPVAQLILREASRARHNVVALLLRAEHQ